MGSWLATDGDGHEHIFEFRKPLRNGLSWLPDRITGGMVNLPHGSIRKLIGRDLTWEDEPVELKEN